MRAYLHRLSLHAHLVCRAYGNEKQVGEGIRKSGVPRSEIFVSDPIESSTLLPPHFHHVQLTTKIWATRINDVEKALDESLANLGTDYLDRESSFHCVVIISILLRTPEARSPLCGVLERITYASIHIFKLWRTNMSAFLTDVVFLLTAARRIYGVTARLHLLLYHPP